jgi:tripartite-type tricarboxylate transporter receptor subunit TctC
MHFTARLVVASLALFGAITWTGIGTANAYPTSIVTIVVPYPAGTATDGFGRLFARRLEIELGQKFVVENRPGANGMNGSESMARSKPDGYTLLFTTNSSKTSVQGLYKRVPYDPVKDFEPVGIIYGAATMLVVRSDLNIETLPQLIAHAKANPGKLSIGTANATGQIAVEILKKRAGVDVVGVPYRGTPQALADLLGGSLQLMVADIATAGAQMEAGKLKPLAFFSKDRNPLFPNVVTYNETIAPGVDMGFWTAVFAPKDTPRSVIDTLAAALKKCLDHQEIKDQAAKIGVQLMWEGPDQVKARLPDDIKRWTALIKEAGIEPE